MWLAACDQEKVERATVLPLAPNRAYSGAPPVIDHPVGDLGRAECLSCHLDGDALDSRGRRPPPTPHPDLERCTACHVEQREPGSLGASLFRGRTYTVGLRSQPSGPWLIPHPLTMREDCLACHGERAPHEQLRTTHPERKRCTQCHLPAHEGFPGARHREERR